MNALPTEMLKLSSVPAPRMIIPSRRTIAEHQQASGAKPSPQPYFWARTSNYVGAMCVVLLGLGLHLYYVREMLASLILFSVFFFSLSLVALSVFFVCYAGNQAVIWAGPASRVAIAFFQRQDSGRSQLARVPVVEDLPLRPTDRNSKTM